MANAKLTQMAIEFNTPELVGLINDNVISSLLAIEQAIDINQNKGWMEFFNSSFYGLTDKQVLQKFN